LLTYCGAITLAVTLGRSVVQRRIRMFVRAAAGFTVFECAVAIVQIVRGQATGVWLFGEVESGFRPIAGVMAASGTLIHANALGIIGAIATVALCFSVAQATALGLTQADRRIAQIGACAGACAVSLTLSRGAQITLLVIVFSLVITKDRRTLGRFTAMFALTIVISMAARPNAWIERSKATTTTNTQVAGSGRIALANQAIAIAQLDPIFGVGAGGYIPAIDNNPNIRKMSHEYIQVHNLGLYVLATQGTIGVAALAAVTAGMVLRLRRQYWSTAVLIALVPGLLLDVALFLGAGPAWTALCSGLALGIARTSPTPSND
jgi:hypothetical protein